MAVSQSAVPCPTRETSTQTDFNTHALSNCPCVVYGGSPAIDAGYPATPGSGGNACAANDQRGYARPVDGDNYGSALCDMGAYEVGATPPGAGTTTTITHLYDNLYRLTNATYSAGDVFTYTYDAVGNQLTQTPLRTQPSTPTTLPTG